MNADIQLYVSREDVLEQLRLSETDAGILLLGALETVGYDVINYLRSHTSKTRPPKRGSTKLRYAHPGGWADVTSVLANSYRFELFANGGERVRWSSEGDRVTVDGTLPQNPRPPFELVFLNGAEYAAALESRDGYFVLAGVTEEGGPVVDALYRVAQAVGFEVEM